MNNNHVLNYHPIQDISHRLLLRTFYFYFLLTNLAFQYYIFYISLMNMENNHNLIYSFNYYLICYLNSSYMMYFLIDVIRVYNYINQTVFKIINYIIETIELGLRIFATLLNLTVIFDYEFMFFSFYLWNLLLMFNIYIMALSKINSVKNLKPKKLPGKKIKTQEICSICLENNSNWVLPCQHKYHFNCINKWFIYNKTCPYCRTKLD